MREEFRRLRVRAFRIGTPSMLLRQRCDGRRKVERVSGKSLNWLMKFESLTGRIQPLNVGQPLGRPRTRFGLFGGDRRCRG
jgi:hypothetical protein